MLLLSVAAVAEGHRFKGFRKFYRGQDENAKMLRTVFDEQWFVQKLDHFNGADSREWKQVQSLYMLLGYLVLEKK